MLTINKGRHILHSRRMQSVSDICHSTLVSSFFHISNYLFLIYYLVINVNSKDFTFVRM